MQTLAIDCSCLRDLSNLPAIFGFDSAVRGLIGAVIRRASYERVLLFHPPQMPILPALAEPRVAKDVEWVSMIELPRIMRQGKISAWLQPDGETEKVNLRQAFTPSPFPFTSLIHVASSPDIVRSHFAWLLLDSFSPYDSLICTSESVKKVIQETIAYVSEEMAVRTGSELTYGGRLDILPHGVNTVEFSPQPKPMVRDELGWEPDAFTILWLGRFSVIDKADLLPLLRVFDRLLEANPQRKLRLILAGRDRIDIPFLPAIKEFIAGLGIQHYTQIIEDVPDQLRPKLFAGADVFVSPVDNLQETFGITPIEAMACGTPQIVSDWSGYKDTVVDNVTGFRIPAYWAKCDGDDRGGYGIGGFGYQGFLYSQTVCVALRELQQAIQRLLDCPGLAEEMGIASRRRAVTTYDWQVVAEGYETLWKELTAIAATTSLEELPYPPFTKDRICTRFASFPTDFLQVQDRVRTSAEGRRLLAQVDPFPWHNPIERQLFDIELAASLLNAANDSTLSIEALLSGSNARNNQFEVLRAIMWGLKHGLLDLELNRV